MDADLFKYRHILLSGTSTTEKFVSPQAGRSSRPKIPGRNKIAHHRYLLSQLKQADSEFVILLKKRKAVGIDGEIGMTLTFRSEPNFELQFESLEFRRAGIELLAVKEIDEITYASVSIPDGKLKYFINKIEKYGTEETRQGKPKNQTLVASISEIRKASLDSLWTDEKEMFPKENQPMWWEVWLRAGKNQTNIVNFFRVNAHNITELKLSSEELRFPDRAVLLAFGTPQQMIQSIDLLNCIAELRRAKESPEFFTEMKVSEQRQWADDLRRRTSPASSDTVALCILDTGITRGHPLIKDHLSVDDMHAYDLSWLNHDDRGHGTGMAGLALYGDLMDQLESFEHIEIAYVLESVKILPPFGDNDPKLYGAITSASISRVEIESPERKRITSMAITAPDNRDQGKPSSWSAEIDNLCSGAEDDTKRLLIVAAGNTDPLQRHLYPNSNLTDSIHDPAQAWNPLCAGAFTEKVNINQTKFPGWHPIAPKGDLSPSSTTSLVWKKQWPIKPDIVFEGGNNAIDPATNKADSVDSLQLLTTHHRPQDKLFEITGDTSAATAQVARMAAIIQAEYPDYWPETIRALIVHSAEWSSSMEQRCSPLKKKEAYLRLLRYCGFGEPNLIRAIRSANNALTLIVQDELYPYEKVKNQCVTRDMHIHRIPWPVEVLEELNDIEVEMRVTLSYFIEPNPARRGWTKRYGYSSHQLRFDVKTPTETIDHFRMRINKAARDEENAVITRSDSTDWLIGTKLRHRGSLHSDRWRGPAIELAQRGYIGIYPVSGWWKERHQLERWDRPARYSLIVSINTPETDVDVYTPVANQVGIPIEV